MSELRVPNPRHTPMAVIGVLVALVLAVFGVLLVAGQSGLPTSVPSCSWPLRVRGRAAAERVELIRCYVRAVARHDLPALQTLVTPGFRATTAQLSHSADARAGVATVAFTANPSDSADFTVRIHYADGVRESLPLMLANPQSWNSWRIMVGQSTSSGPDIPPSVSGRGSR